MKIDVKVGFTLAEILITLGIVVVVATLTIPNLIAHSKAKVMETQFKKTYSILSNATKLIIEQEISPYSLTTAERVDEYTKVLGASHLSNMSYYWKNLTGKANAHLGAISVKPILMLKDGTIIIIGFYNWIFVDINGSKVPNQVGYDIHVFKIMPDDSLAPVSYPAHDTRKCTLANLNSTDSYLGYGCTEYAVLNKNPDGTGNYWYNFLKQK